jgi:hypothetical protein
MILMFVGECLFELVFLKCYKPRRQNQMSRLFDRERGARSAALTLGGASMLAHDPFTTCSTCLMESGASSNSGVIFILH